MTKIAGYIVRWADVADVDGHRERVECGAFRHTRSSSLRVAHDSRPGAVIAWAVPVTEDDQGLRFTATLDEARPEHRRVIAALRDGMNAVSFGYRSKRSRQDGDIEVIEEARLLEISLLGAGAYPGSRAWIV